MGLPLTGMWVERVLGLDMTLGLVSLTAPSGLFSKMSIDLPGGSCRASQGWRLIDAACWIWGWLSLSGGQNTQNFGTKFLGLEPTLNSNTRTAEGASRSIPRVPRGRSKDNGVRNKKSCSGKTTSRTTLRRERLTKLTRCSLRTPSSKPRESSTRAAQSPFPIRFRTCGTSSRALRLVHTTLRNSLYYDGFSRT